MAFVLQHRILVYSAVHIFRENRTQQMQISLQLSGALFLSLWDLREAKHVCRAYIFFFYSRVITAIYLEQRGHEEAS